MSAPKPYQGARPASYDLASGKVLPLQTAKGVEIRSTLGRLWVTEEGTTGDHFLRPGERYRIRGAGRVVIEALDTSRVEISAPVALPARIARTVATLWRGRGNKRLEAALR